MTKSLEIMKEMWEAKSIESMHIFQYDLMTGTAC